MPFQLPERPVTLVFDKGSLLGLELTVRLSIPFDFYFTLTEMLLPVAKGKVKETTAEAIERNRRELDDQREHMQRFAEEALIGWNLHDRAGEPVPCTPAAFTAHVDPLSFGAMLGRYMAAIGGVPGPLAPASGNGRTSKARPASTRRASLSRR